MSDLKPGKYRMTVEVEVDEEGYLLPHDSGEMFMAAWWTENDATFEPVPPPQCNECGWWLTARPASCPSCGTATGLGVSGEDRSEPTPALREPRVWFEDDPEPDPRPRVVTTPDGRERIYAEDWGGWVLRNEIGGPVDQWDDLPKPLTEVLSEVVTPEGTP